MKELSVFVDESGDFGDYDYHSPFYIISLVFHNQSVDIKEDLNRFEKEMIYIGWPNHCVHAGLLLRTEKEYKDCSLEERQRLIKKIMGFTRKLDISVKSIYVEKKKFTNSIDITGILSKQLATFIKENMEYFLSFDLIKIYYDSGQVEVTRVLSSVFNSLLDNVQFKKVVPAEYRLFQVADLICTLKLTELKMNNHLLTKSDHLFFDNERTFKKNYLKIIELKEL